MKKPSYEHLNYLVENFKIRARTYNAEALQNQKTIRNLREKLYESEVKLYNLKIASN